MKINDIFDKITMILCVLVTLVLISAPGWATTYYVSNTGSDSSSGTSTGSPWKTVSKVNSRSFSPGDNILFERGDQWMEQLNNSSDGTSGNYITYGAYGTGNKPIIDLNTPGLANAIYNGSNSWIIYENFEIIGDRDRNSNSYCVTFTSGANNCIVRSCTIRDHGSISGGMYGDGVAIFGGCSNITVSGCQLSGHGGRGVRIYQNTNTAANNIIFEKNIIRDNHHTVALDLQEGGGTGDVTNVIFRYNRVYDTQTSDADPAIYIDGSSSCDFINLQIYGNLFYDVYGRGIAVQDTQGPVYIYNNTFYRSSSSGYDHIDVESEAGTVSIRNNIFYDTYGYFLNIANASGKSVDYNCYYNTVGTGLNRVGSSTYTTSQWSAYVRATGFDTNGMYSNPYVKSPSTDNFILLSNSPCIDEGMNLGSSYADGIDPDSTWPENVSTLDQDLFGSAWEIGAYVYASDLSGLDTTPPVAPSNISTSIQ